MTARIQAAISDFLSARGLDDRSGFALAASRTLAMLTDWTAKDIERALGRTKTDFFRVSGVTKKPLLSELAARLATEEPTRSARPQKCTVLLLSANPLATNSQLALDEEVRAIREVLLKSKNRAAVELVDRWAVKPGDVLQHLNDYRPDALHFSGHGHCGRLVLAGDNGSEKHVSDHALDLLFRAASDRIRIAVLNYCDSLEQARIAVKHIDSAIGMSAPISDDAACVFSAAFYRAFSYGATVRSAYEQALAAMALEGIPEDHIPKLVFRRGVRRTSLRLAPLTADPRQSRNSKSDGRNQRNRRQRRARKG